MQGEPFRRFKGERTFEGAAHIAALIKFKTVDHVPLEKT